MKTHLLEVAVIAFGSTLLIVNGLIFHAIATLLTIIAINVSYIRHRQEEKRNIAIRGKLLDQTARIYGLERKRWTSYGVRRKESDEELRERIRSFIIRG